VFDVKILSLLDRDDWFGNENYWMISVELMRITYQGYSKKFIEYLAAECTYDERLNLSKDYALITNR
jgi:hypothetical protein